jgi:hypothetical protein
MATAKRRAEVVWEGDLARGKGRFTVESGDGRKPPPPLLAISHGPP